MESMTHNTLHLVRRSVSFFVPGIPAPGGSKRFVGFSKATGRAILIDAAGQRNKDWRSVVSLRGSEAMAGVGGGLFSGPLHVSMVFYMPRPSGHFGRMGTPRNGAPEWPITRPDALKLTRSTEDALTGIIWNDDAQTVVLDIQKRYASALSPAGCVVTVKEM